MADSNGNKPFVHLHVHTDYSLLDGCARVDRYMKRCQELNMPALALTDHGNLFGAINFYRACKKANIKPLIGCEIYLVHDHKQADRPKRDRKRSDDINDVPEEALGPQDFPQHQIHHKTLIAANFEGYQNLVKLVSDAHLNGVYYRPRTDMEKLAQHSKGIIGLSGCINGVAAQHLIYNNYEMARQVTADFIDIFGKENYFIELQNHGMPVQKRILPGLVKLAKEFDLKMVAANDVHYVYQDDWKPHDSLLCIQTGRAVSEEDRMKYPNQEFYLKSYEEMAEIFKELPDSVDNTLHVAEMVDLDIPFGENHYPKYERPIEVSFQPDKDNFERVLDIYVREKNKINTREGKPLIELTPEEREAFRKNGVYLFDLCKKGLKERYGVDYDEVRAGKMPESIDPDYAKRVCDQLEYELGIIAGTGFVDYFLIVWDFIDWARDRGIPVGPGRGSGAGCLVAYVLKITDIDPLRFGLLFERMLNLERVSPPDFDVDFCMRRRDEVVNYVRDKYGRDCVANIITYGTFGAKMVVRDIARVLEIPYAEANRIAKMIPDDLNISLDGALEKSHELNAEQRSNPLVAEILNQGKVIEGMVRNTGKHACGIIIGDQPITNLVPVTLQDQDLTTQYAKGPVEDLGLLKCDFLGLKTLTVISDAQENVRRTTAQKDFDIEKIPLDDQATYDLLNSGRTTGVFQLESGGMQTLCRQIGLSSFEEIIALIALYRPGPMQFIPQFIKGKKDPSTIKIPHPLLKDLVYETYGVLVYQEQVMQAAQIIAGYTLGGADILRRAMGKKIKEAMDAQRAVFVEGAKKTNNIDRKTAEEIFGILEKFAEYGFNKSHSAAYAMLSYRTAYLKANYPVQFMAALLSSELGNADKVSHFIGEAKAMGVPVLGPDVNISRESFTPVFNREGEGSIRFGLAAIKGVGDGAAKAIIQECEENGQYKDFRDFVERVDGKAVNKRVMENLILTGAFDFCGVDRGILQQNMDSIIGAAASLQKDREAGQSNLFDMLGGGDDTASGEMEELTGEPMEKTARLLSEKLLLGFYVSGHPLDDYADLAKALSTFEGDEYTEMESNEPFRLCGVVNTVEKKLSKKDNRPWAIVNIGTTQKNYELMLYADAYERFSENLELGHCVIVSGVVLRGADDARLTIDTVAPLAESIPGLATKITWILDPKKDVKNFLAELHKSIRNNFGSAPVQVGFKIDEKSILVYETASSLTTSITSDFYTPLRNHPACLSAILDTRPPEVREPAWKQRMKASRSD